MPIKVNVRTKRLFSLFSSSVWLYSSTCNAPWLSAFSLWVTAHYWKRAVPGEMPLTPLLAVLSWCSLIRAASSEWAYFIGHLFKFTPVISWKWKQVSWSPRTPYLFPTLGILKKNVLTITYFFILPRFFLLLCCKLCDTRWLQTSPRVRILWPCTKSSWWAVAVWASPLWPYSSCMMRWVPIL